MSDSIMVYIASPYTGDEDDNTLFQIFVANELRRFGFLPFWPLCTHYWHQKYPHAYEYWMEMDFEWIGRCDALLRVGGPSESADREAAYAVQKGIPVYNSVFELLAGERIKQSDQ